MVFQVSYKDMKFADLRAQAALEKDPNQYSAQSWMSHAKKCADEAALAEREGRQEEAFVKYVKACGFFQLFLDHRDYLEIKANRSSPLWHDYISFSQNRSSYLSRAKALSEILRTRDIENSESSSSKMGNSEPAPVTPTTASAREEPDVSAGGSIAARMAALRGAGMQVQTHKRVSRDAGGSASPSLQTPISAGLSASSTGGLTNGSRSPVTSSGLGSTTPIDQSNSRRGSIATSQYSPHVQLDQNKTGSSFTSIKSLQYPSRLAPNSQESVGQDAEESGARTPNTTVDPPVSSPHDTSRALPTVPVVTSHHHKASLPNMPSYQPGQISSLNNHLSNGTTTPNRSFQNITDASVSSRHNSVAEQEDDMAHFASSFPSLDEFEHKPDFAMPPLSSVTPSERPWLPRQRSGNAKLVERPDTIAETKEDEADGLKMPRLPSPPRGKPGIAELNGKPTDISLGVPDLPQRPSSLPMPDLEVASPIATSPGFLVNKSNASGPPPLAPKPQYKPAMPLPSAPKPASTSSPAVKPSLPFTNAIMPGTLVDYLENPTLKILLVDVRPSSEHKLGWIGADMQSNSGGSPGCVWVDPTILQRKGLDSNKLESALSLQPTAEQRAFENRKDYDLVVIYDTAAKAFPPKDASATAPSTLFSLIFEKEFRKILPRSPVLLVGGFEGWEREQQVRRRSVTGSVSQTNGYTQVAKGTPPVLPVKKTSLPPSGSSLPSPGSPDFGRSARRETGVYRSSAYSRDITENFAGGYPQSMAGYSGGYNGQPMIPSSLQAGPSRLPSSYNRDLEGGPKPPPPATSNSIPGPLSRRRSDYIEHHNQPYSGYVDRSSRQNSVSYPNLAQPQVPPPAASAATGRQETRPQPPRSESIISFDSLSKLPDQDDMLYWSDVGLGISGLKNLGNTCYMNSTLQCLSATFPLARFFRDGSFKRAINTVNPLGTKGDLAKAFATLVSMLWEESYTFLSPVTFRKSIGTFAPSFAGTEQHDSQEFLSFLLDGLHEDLNRIKSRPPPVEMTPEREAALETLPPSVAAEKEWRIYKQRNDSFVVDLFQGQYRNRLECLTCHKTSTTYDTFMYLSLPLPSQNSKISVYELIDDFTKSEIMDGEDAWHCPRCKQLRRSSKTLSIARLPPVLLIHFKRFMARRGGLFYDKSETPVIFPATRENPLDLTRWMPQDAAGGGHPRDPMQMNGPYKYELFALSNHQGNLSNGHYTAFVKSQKGSGDKNWMYCDDSKITQHTVNDVVARPDKAYILFYKRMQT